MTDKCPKEGWELRSFSSGNLKKSSSVEILLGTHPTKGRMLATSPSGNKNVTHMDMKGSGRPTKENRNTLPPPSSSSSSSTSKPSQNGRSGASGSESNGRTVPATSVPNQSTVPPSAVPKDDKPLIPDLEETSAVPSTVPSQKKKDSKIKAVHPEVIDTNILIPEKVKPQIVPKQTVPNKNPTKTQGDFMDPNSLRRDLETPPITSSTSSKTSNPLKDHSAPQTYPNTSQPPNIPKSTYKTPQTSSQSTKPTPHEVSGAKPQPNPSQSQTNLSQSKFNPVSASTPQQTSTQSTNPTPIDTPEVQTQPNLTKTPPAVRNIKKKGCHLPPLVTSFKQEYQSPLGTPRGTPRGTPKGTPIIGKRGHVFSVSTPEVEPETGHPLPFDIKLKKSLAECLGDPFDYRRNVKQPETEKKDAVGEAGEGGGGGGGGTCGSGGGESIGTGGGGTAGTEEGEPIWQRRLSLLFVPPTEDELEPEKDTEETSRLLPVTVAPEILRKQTIPGVTSPSPSTRKRDRSPAPGSGSGGKGNKKREKEVPSRRDREKRSSQEKQRLSRINFEEERNRSREERRKGKEERKGNTKVSRQRDSSASDDPEPSLSSDESSEEEKRKTEDEEEEEEEEEEEAVKGREDDGTSWDDTICSNRSAYFKKYYTQRSATERSPEEKENSFKTPFEASHNSLSSLIKERMTKSAANQGGQNTSQVGLIVLVVVLLLIIVMGISLTTYFYHQHLEELSIFNRIKFYEGERHLEVYGPSWNPILTLNLGTNLPKHSIPDDCTDYLSYLQKKNYSLPHHGLDDDNYEEMICLDWTSLAQLHLRKLNTTGPVQCYSVWWLALKKDFTLRDCLLPHTIINEKNITWWGGGEMTSGGYPVKSGNVPPSHMVTGKIDRDPWGQILRRTWLSDQATLLMLPARFRGRVSVNHRMDNRVCLEMPVSACTTDDPNLSYTLCTAPDLNELTEFMHQRAIKARQVVGLVAPNIVNYTLEDEDLNEAPNVTVLQETFSPDVLTMIENRMEYPVYIPWMTPDKPELTQERVVEYVNRLNTNTTGFRGHILLPPSWQTRPGEMDFDPDRFPDPLNFTETLKSKGFNLVLTLHPFVSVDAPGFSKGLREGLWVRQRNSLLPALAKYDERYPSVVTDFTNPRAREWYAAQLKKLKSKYHIDHFHLNPTDAHALPTFHEYHEKVSNPDDTIFNFMASVSTVAPPLSTSGAIMPPLPPTFVTLGSGDGSWNALKTLIPRALTLSMLGFPFLDIGPIGGLARAGHVPDRELYIRWIEVATFLPSMQISVLPSTYGKEVVNLAREYNKLRKSQVLPRLMKKIPEAIDKGKPLITPLALFLPNDKEAGKVNDQWMIGNDLLVAPVVTRGKRSRSFYLPRGIWKDGIDGKLKNGGRWIKNYKVLLTKIPHFYLRYVDDFDR